MCKRMSGWRRGAGIVLVLGAGLARAGDATPPTVTVIFEPATTQLQFIEPRDAARLLAERRPAPVNADGAAERELLAFCANGEPQREFQEKGFALNVATAIYQVVLVKAAEKVHAELAKYSSVSEHSGRIDYYRAESTPAGSARLTSRYSCLRFTRYVAKADGELDTALDFVAGIGLDTDGSAVLLRPLRLYVSNLTARSATGRYGVAISLRGEAVWREEIKGNAAVVFDQKLVTTGVDLKSKSFLAYYPTVPLIGHRVPIVPVSFGSDRSRDFGRIDVTLTIAETGVPPATLILLSQLLPPVADRKTALLVDAANAAAQGAP